jgi:hypothetical protein
LSLATVVSDEQAASALQLVGAFLFGTVVGWYLYYINRHREGAVRLSDLVTVIGAVGGGTLLAVFPAGSDLFGAYGIGLFCGFFGYLTVLFLLVRKSANFGVDFFIDGRRKPPSDGEVLVPGPDNGAMGEDTAGGLRR